MKLGFAGVIRGFDLDTSYFTGNQAPVASVDVCRCEDGNISEAEVCVLFLFCRITKERVNLFPYPHT